MSAAAAVKGPARSRQAVLVEPRRLEIREVTRPHPGPGELLISIRCALSCGTDLKAFRRGHPLWPMPTPFGHEFSGVVEEVGVGVTTFRRGDQIMAAPTAPCGACFFCKREQENLCRDGVGRMVMGAYADLLLLPAHIVARNTFPKPDGLPFEEAALLEPMSCVVHAQSMASPQPHETGLIIGAGAFGLMHMLLLRATGIAKVVVAGRGEQRLKWAGELGADEVIDVSRSDPAAAVARLNRGFGPDLVIECTGQVDGWSDAFARVRRGGRVVFFGGCAPGTTLAVDTRRMHYDNLTLLAPFHYRTSDVRRTCQLLAERGLGVGGIINAHRELAELNEVFAMLEQGAALKCAVTP